MSVCFIYLFSLSICLWTYVSIPRHTLVYLDENISWKHHINIVSTKVCKSIGILYRTRCILNNFIRKQLYFSFTNCHLNYLNIAWVSTNKSNKLSIAIRRMQEGSEISKTNLLLQNHYLNKLMQWQSMK